MNIRQTSKQLIHIQANEQAWNWLLALGVLTGDFVNLKIKTINATCNCAHTRRFDSNFSHNSKSYSKFGLPYEGGPMDVMGVK